MLLFLDHPLLAAGPPSSCIACGSAMPCGHTPSHLPPSCSALRCRLATPSGAQLQVVIGVPPAVAADQRLLEHALRQTLVADSLSLQFRLPPAGVPPPAPRVTPGVLGGTPTVECLAMTSVWAVHTLRLLAQVRGRRLSFYMWYRRMCRPVMSGDTVHNKDDLTAWQLCVHMCAPGGALTMWRLSRWCC
jgi:hypothetical protein